MNNILVVDDEYILREVIIEFLELQYDFNYFEAKGGSEALDVIKNNSIDLLITDIKMANMGGIELISQVKNIPIILISGCNEEELSEIKSLNKNIIGFLAKPYSIESLFSLVDSLE